MGTINVIGRLLGGYWRVIRSSYDDDSTVIGRLFLTVVCHRSTKTSDGYFWTVIGRFFDGSLTVI